MRTCILVTMMPPTILPAWNHTTKYPFNNYTTASVIVANYTTPNPFTSNYTTARPMFNTTTMRPVTSYSRQQRFCEYTNMRLRCETGMYLTIQRSIFGRQMPYWNDTLCTECKDCANDFSCSMNVINTIGWKCDNQTDCEV